MSVINYTCRLHPIFGNGRMYSEEAMNKAIMEYKKKVDAGIAFGHLENSNLISHKIIDIKPLVKRLPRKKKKALKKKGEYDSIKRWNNSIVTIQTMPNLNQDANTLHKMLEGKMDIGISSRGYASEDKLEITSYNIVYEGGRPI